MSAPVKLRGMTWSHPRGYDPMVACSQAWQEKTGVEIIWEKRSLQGFESFPVDELARAYDLIVIDHPHVGQITRENCLLPLDVPGREAERAALAAASVGLSYPSYTWQGHQWAFPIDAATQVLAFRPDLIDAAPATWNAVLDLARAGRVMLPLRPPHSLMSFYTLAGNLGTPCRVEGDMLIDPADGARVWDMLTEIATLVDPACMTMDPIDVFEEMARAESTTACAPLIYGYVNYAQDGFRPATLQFADMPVAGDAGPVGSAIGGTGIAVSAFCAAPDAAIDFAYWIASADVQRGLYTTSGGQPGHGTAWEDAAVNAGSGNFYAGTRATLEGGWLRPRHDGYMAYQEAAAQRINSGLLGREAAAVVVADLNRMFRESF